MKILNLHGFMGEADNKNYKALCGILPSENIISPQLEYKETSQSELLEKLSDMVNSDDFIFVGQSLGGWYADKLSRKFKRPCILTNPCYFPYDLEFITSSGIPANFVDEYRKMSANTQNERAYTLCSDADNVLPENYQNREKLSEQVIIVHGSHITIENVGEHISEMLTEIENDRLLLFLGRGSAFADEHNSAFFVEDNELVLIDCPATSYQKVKKMNWDQYDNIYILITHTHGDHSGGIGTMLKFVWFASYMKKKVTIVAPSAEVKEDLLLLLMRIEGCEKEWFDIITADELNKKWFIAAVPTTHVKPLQGKCFGYHLDIHGNNVVYTGDTATLDPFKPLLKIGSFLYTEAAYYKSDVHLCLKDIISDFNNKKYYNGRLKIKTGELSANSLIFSDIQYNTTDYKNTAPAEADKIVQFVKMNKDKSIGIITPFANQRDCIQKALHEAKLDNVTCGTVHAFQGDEKDIILFSLALTDKTNPKTYDWLKNNRELVNVAVSRAKEQLIVLSSKKELERLHDPDQPDDIYELVNYVASNGRTEVTPKDVSSRALGIKPYSTETEEAFLQNLNHALDNILLNEGRCSVEREVAISQVFMDNPSCSDLFYTGRFDFVIYQRDYSNRKMPVLAIELDGKEHIESGIVRERDRKKNKICRDHGFELIRIENSYARRYNFIKSVLIDYFGKRSR